MYYKQYIKKYEQKIQIKQKGKQLEKVDIDNLESLEKILTLESILDVRNMLKEKYKVRVIDYFNYIFGLSPLISILYLLDKNRHRNRQ